MFHNIKNPKKFSYLMYNIYIWKLKDRIGWIDDVSAAIFPIHSLKSPELEYRSA